VDDAIYWVSMGYHGDTFWKWLEYMRINLGKRKYTNHLRFAW
jgi:hypothetical protein